ncbi:MAG: thioredoxin family protein [Candidatus Cloacimonadaceae bacterium]|jgi:protein disulfide-isomerase|nr:thioredoxin family protein [Candidatus Cloacimonadota bacterium]MDY0126611.1 thioredoxin family protein [Candidatus Cloacimonadaceae bacterium]MCB5255225.1 thioredoxin family protein [Candidatus Cloacimonadota bacterium]MCK9177447.1 thioredoxin family protein [Candidatus Cloacimonadota bacterium]MCK9241931.1 thioredoxin family protein [Candidatus Cloacimonadota bacterium]
MKYILFILLLSMVAVLGCTPAENPADDAASKAVGSPEEQALDATEYELGTWTENWDLALSTAKELNRPILVNFTGSDWCVWCVRLVNEVFSKAEFQKYAKENLVLLKLDYPRNISQDAALKKQNDELQKQFGIRGYPTILLVDSAGKEINRTGYQQGGVESYIKHLQDLLK